MNHMNDFIYEIILDFSNISIWIYIIRWMNIYNIILIYLYINLYYAKYLYSKKFGHSIIDYYIAILVCFMDNSISISILIISISINGLIYLCYNVWFLISLSIWWCLKLLFDSIFKSNSFILFTLSLNDLKMNDFIIFIYYESSISFLINNANFFHQSSFYYESFFEIIFSKFLYI